LILEADAETGEVAVVLGEGLQAACADWPAGAVRVVTARREDRVWAWTLGEMVPS
jgi:hypothetical protein